MRNGDEAQPDGGNGIFAQLNRISAQQGFPEGDPRRGPFDQAQVRQAQDFLFAPRRWHATKRVDLYAVRLQYGRGMRRTHAAQMFRISESVIKERRARKGKSKWISMMSECDRRRLARLVWLGGLLRPLLAAKEPDGRSLFILKAASEWERLDAPERDWLPEDEHGEAEPMEIDTEIANDERYTDRNFSRNERAGVWERLEAELDAVRAAADAEYEANAAGDALQEGGELPGDET